MAREAKAPQLLKIKEVAARLAVSERKAWELIGAGAFPSVKLGPRCTRFREADVAAYVAKRTQA